MTTLEMADGRLLRSQPTGLRRQTNQAGFFPPMWSDGERWGETGVLVSFEQIYRTQPVVAGVVDKLTRRISTLPFDGYSLNADGSREMVRGDALASLLRHPLPRSSGTHLRAHIAQSLLIHGNAVVAKVRGSDRQAPPEMLWPMDWAQLSAYGEGRIEWWSTTQFGGQERFFRAEDAMHFAWPAPDGGEIGVSPLEKLGVTLKLEDAAQREQVSIFEKGSRPSMSVSVEGNPRVEQLEYIRQRVEANHRGVSNSGRTFFMGANVKVQPLSMSPVETALIEQRRLSREEVGAVYDLAGPLMNDLTHGTYSNVSELLRSMYRDVLPPWLTLIEDTFQTQLLDLEPAWTQRFVAHDLTDKLKGDPVELATSLKMQVEAGLLTRNEARRILNLPAVEDDAADLLTAQVNNQGLLSAMPEAGPPSAD
jgi:HK97 family phage portal protein